MTNAQQEHEPLKLKHINFEQSLLADGLAKLDGVFLEQLRHEEESLYQQLMFYRQGQAFTNVELSEFIISLAEFLESFIADMFTIDEAVASLQCKTIIEEPIHLFKHQFVQKLTKKRLLKDEPLLPYEELQQWLEHTLEHSQYNGDLEQQVAQLGLELLTKPEDNAEAIEQLTCFCIHAQDHYDWVSLKRPQRLDYEQLVTLTKVPKDPLGRLQGSEPTFRQRQGFELTDQRMSQRQVQSEIHYCVYCHNQDGDFCSKGFPVKKKQPELGLKTNPLGEPLTGCPLEQKISEMNVLKRRGFVIAPLAAIMLDNPMCPVTGHRICNECMKACIYQKQDPVNIPEIETRILTDVLSLPWGVEIYDLLCRWNPLRQTQWLAKPYNGAKILIMGMGPAGFTMAHHLLMEGFAVVGVDGLKIEPLDNELINKPIYAFNDIKEKLSERVMSGFGGVAEYGITVRWDKNFLKLIYLSLLRRPHFQVFGNVRFGGTLLVEDVWRLGFDHMVLAVGAGLPRELAIKNSLAPGMRQANDFLMALQLTGAAKLSSLANLQVRLPAVVIGGGLTGIDTATEVQAYYLTQIEKVHYRYHKLCQLYGDDNVKQAFDEKSWTILQELLTHAREYHEAKKAAKAAGQPLDTVALLRRFGGVTIVYRRNLNESPAYRRNHEEVIKALQEGIYYLENCQPCAVEKDSFGDVSALICENKDKQTINIPCKSIYVATGAKPNIAYEFEHRGTFHREGSEYQAYELGEEGPRIVHPEGHCKITEFGPFTSYQQDEKRVTFIGDTHPIFHGNVVKAVASAKKTYPKILKGLPQYQNKPGHQSEYQAFKQKILQQFSAELLAIKRLTSSVIELTIKAPMICQNFKAGHFYRVQNFETTAAMVLDTKLQTEGIALLATTVDSKKGELSLIAIEKGCSSRLLATLQVGQPLAVMGPTGVRTHIPRDNETVVIIGGELAAARLLALGPELTAAGNKVIFVGMYQAKEDCFYQSKLEQACNNILWLTEQESLIIANRPQDKSTNGEVIAELTKYLQEQNIVADRIIVSGSTTLHQQILAAAQQSLRPNLSSQPIILASVYGPMQCMLKGVCAQCLQWQIDPVTKQRTKAVYACSWQDQPIGMIDLNNLDERLGQNTTLEILSNLWLDYLFEQQPERKLW